MRLPNIRDNNSRIIKMWVAELVCRGECLEFVLKGLPHTHCLAINSGGTPI